ncbi:XdhC family protein [Martelella mangrovi]|uniref:Xanthine dehydrogenase accessory factor n=1 Tax=Martelella mangrovi TaxID=1397477 RepID=A0ABV2IEH8_9HYPH
MNDTTTVLSEALAWSKEGRRVALATVVSTWGSSPRPVASHLAVDEEGRFVGSVSGGCVEGAVIQTAGEVIENGEPRLLKFGVADETAWQVGLACGGTIEVFVERLADAESLSTLVNDASGSDVAALVTLVPEGQHCRLLASGAENGDLILDSQEHAGVANAVESSRSGFVDGPSRRLFVEVWEPPLRLIVVGAVHITQYLAPLAVQLGYEVTVIDPRSAFASAERLPEVTLIDVWPDDAIATLRPDRRTAVVVLTHDPKFDDPALIAALQTPAFYIAALGSRRTHAKRLDRLTSAGCDAAALDRINGPAGLDIGARTPPEIALSVVAEMTAQLRRPATSIEGSK